MQLQTQENTNCDMKIALNNKNKIGLSQSFNQEKLWIKFAKWNDLKRIPRHFQKEKKVLKSMDSEKIYVE